MNEGSLVAVDTLENLRAEHGEETFVVTVDAVPESHGVGSLDGVDELVVDRKTLRLNLDSPRRKARVVRALEAAGATVLNMETERTPMTELFHDIAEGGER